MAKPFSIQAPEEIAKEYAGDKQRIAQAAQMGVVDPTAAILAGMFIDRMRGAQAQEGASPPTVAQDVMGGAPPAPPASPSPAPGGLGAMPPMAPQMAPQMGPMPPQGAPMEAPMGMAEGGIVGLNIPDTMFDEPSNGGFDDGYAGGGIVAFADGGPTGSSSWGSYIEEMVRRLDPNIQVAGRARTPARNAEVGGVAGSYHLIDAARDIRTPEGMDKSEFIAQLKSVFGPDYDILPSKGASVHIEPGPKLGERVRAGVPASNAPAVTPERDVSTAAGRMGSLEDILAAVQGINRKSPMEQEAEARVRARLEERASTEDYEKQRKGDMWQTLAEIGFNMASSKSPYVLQAIGEAAAAAMPGARADRKERKAAQDRAIEGLMELGARNRKEAMEGLKVAIPVWQAGVDAEQFERKLQLSEAELGLARDKLNAEIEAAKNKGVDVDTAVFQMFTSGDPAMKQVAQDYLGARYPRAVGTSGGALTPEQIRGNVEAGRGSGFTEGQTAKDTQGKTIVFQGGQWVYP